MALSLAQINALNELAEHLYHFLPGKPHPYADQSLSFVGVATSLGLAQFWSRGSKQPAIVQLLSKTLENRPEKFCPLILEIVRRGITYRQNKGIPITREEIEQLNKIIARLSFKIPELHDPNFLNSLPRANRPQSPDKSSSVTSETLEQLKKELMELTNLPPQERGYRFEKFLGRLFEVFGLAPRSAFRLVGEQIDGSFQFQGDTYLVEAKWQNSPLGLKELLTFYGKVGGKAQWPRGLLISYSGFTQDGLEAFARGRQTNIICMDSTDLYYILHGNLDLRVVLEQKVRYAAETNRAYVSVRELFPNIPAI
jgi:hypothetical protein